MNENILIEIGKRVKQTREALRISQKDFAAALGIKASFLSGVEKGKRKTPGVLIFWKISDVFGVSLDYLIRGSGDMFLKGKKVPADNDRDRNYLDDIETIEDLLWFMERSNFFKALVMGYAGKVKYESESMLKKSIERYRAKNEENEDDDEP